MNITPLSIQPASALLLTIAALCVGLTAHAREPFTKDELKAQENLLHTVVDQGYQLWHGSKADMTTNGLACGNCHPDAAASNPQTFPKYHTAFDRVVTFREMVNWCIQNPQAGKALDVNGPDMLAMEAYAFNLHRGKLIEPGLATRQTTPIKVSTGKGFPSKPSGIGVDK